MQLPEREKASLFAMIEDAITDMGRKEANRGQ
jgi:hypothetical protein